MSVARKITLSNGRTLGYLRFGNEDAETGFYFHGIPGSSKQALFMQRHNVTTRFQAIAFDRPGFGDSTIDAKRIISEGPRMVRELADHLGIKKFHLLGVSGGAPHAVIVADQLRDRILSLTTVSGLGPLHEAEFRQAMHGFGRRFLFVANSSPWVVSKILGAAHAQMKKNRAANQERLSRWLPEADVQVLLRKDVQDTFKESMGHSFEQGPFGAALELKVVQQPWGIRDWNFPFPVRLWHGARDSIVPIEHSRLLAKRIPHAQLIEYEKEGHYSLPILFMDKILEPIINS